MSNITSIALEGGRERVVLNICLYGEVPPRGPTPYPLYTIFHEKGTPFVISVPLIFNSLLQKLVNLIVFSYELLPAFYSYFLCLPLDFRTILKSILSGLCTQLRMPIQRRQIWTQSTLSRENQEMRQTWSLRPWLQRWHLPPLPWWCHPHLLFLRLNQQVMTDVNINNIVLDSN